MVLLLLLMLKMCSVFNKPVGNLREKNLRLVTQYEFTTSGSKSFSHQFLKVERVLGKHCCACTQLCPGACLMLETRCTARQNFRTSVSAALTFSCTLRRNIQNDEDFQTKLVTTLLNLGSLQKPFQFPGEMQGAM